MKKPQAYDIQAADEENSGRELTLRPHPTPTSLPLHLLILCRSPITSTFSRRTRTYLCISRLISSPPESKQHQVWEDEAENSRQLHLAPTTLFSVAAFSQLQSMAERWPQLQVAFEAQTQLSPERPQQVVGLGVAIVWVGCWWSRLVCVSWVGWARVGL